MQPPSLSRGQPQVDKGGTMMATYCTDSYTWSCSNPSQASPSPSSICRDVMVSERKRPSVRVPMIAAGYSVCLLVMGCDRSRGGSRGGRPPPLLGSRWPPWPLVVLVLYCTGKHRRLLDDGRSNSSRLPVCVCEERNTRYI